MPRISPAATLKEISLTRGGAARCSTSKHRRAAAQRASASGAVRVNVRNLSPHHQPHQLGRAHIGGGGGVGDDSAFSKDGDPVGDLEDLFQPMRNEDERLAALGQEPHHIKQPVDLVRRKRGGGLVEDDDFGVDRHRLQDLDHLPLTRREIAQRRAQRQMPALTELLEQGVGARGELTPGNPAGRAKLRQVDIFEHAQIRRQARLLHHHRDAGADRLARRGEARRRAEEPNFAAIGR